MTKCVFWAFSLFITLYGLARIAGAVVTPFRLNFHLELLWHARVCVKWDSKVAQRALKLTSSCQNKGSTKFSHSSLKLILNKVLIRIYNT